MAHGISPTLLAQLSEFVTAHMGLSYPETRWNDLQRGMRAAAREFGFEDAAECAQWLLEAPLTKRHIEILASHLTVGETYFWREKRSFELLEEHILPELIRNRQESGARRLRFWSAGCCTGEEAYSFAILLRRMLPELPEWSITILATDINPRFLQKASEGVYSQWSFRDAPPWLKASCFREVKAGRFAILPEIKSMVTFAYLNLAEDAYPSLLNNTNAMDVIFCRNVLMYLAPAQTQKIIGNFYRCLVEDGWLCVSPSETSHLLFSQFAAVNFPGATLYRKRSFPQAKPARLGEANGLALPAPLPATSTFKSKPSTLKSKVEAPKLVAPPPTLPTLPTSPTLQEARTLHEQGRYGEAVTLLEKLLGDGSGNAGERAPAFALLARVHANQGQLVQALECCARALAADKLNAGYYYLRATILQEQGALEEAVQSLKRALYLDHDFVLAHFALGNLSRQQGKFAEAAKHFANALQLLGAQRSDDILPESEGITAGRLAAIIASLSEGKSKKAEGGRR